MTREIATTHDPAAPVTRLQQAQRQQTRSDDVRRVYERVLTGAAVRSRYVEAGVDSRVHVLEKGAGRPIVLLHGSAAVAGFLLPLINELDGVRVLAPDRPGMGLSDPVDLPGRRFRETAVAWLDRLLDALELDDVTLLGHSAGGLWSLWYALAHPNRVERLVLIGVPALPKTRAPLPIRLMATPGVGALLPRLVPPSPQSMLQFARAMGEQETLAQHPDLIDLLVAVGRDPIAQRVARAEIRALLSPFALAWPSWFRHRVRVRADELRQVATPTLVLWGERDPVGGGAVAQAVSELMPRARLRVLPTGHVPWLGCPAQTAAAVMDLMR